MKFIWYGLKKKYSHFHPISWLYLALVMTFLMLKYLLCLSELFLIDILCRVVCVVDNNTRYNHIKQILFFHWMLIQILL